MQLIIRDLIYRSPLKFIFIKRCLFTLSNFIQDSANIDKVIIKQKKLTVNPGYSEYNC